MISQAAISPDYRWFAGFYREYHGMVHDQALRLTGCALAAADLSQEVFLRCWTRLASLQQARDMPGYLFMLTRNLFIDGLRKEKREQVSMEEFARYYRQCYPPPDDPVQEREYQRLLEGVIQALPPRQREVFLLDRELSLPRKAVALRLGLSEMTVKEHLARAVKKIKKVMEPVAGVK